MLRYLRIQRLAVIDQLEVEFGPGFNVLTGETGAGKSILVEALSLLLGGRASPDLVRSGDDNATVESIFDTPDNGELIVRREINAQGRSRSFLNGSLASLATLRDVTGALVELHGQHEHQVLLDPEAHLDLLDAFGSLSSSRDHVAARFEELWAVEQELEHLRRLQRDRVDRADLLSFQLAEIDRATPRPGEDEELAAERVVLANREKLERLCSTSYASLYENDDAVIGRLAGIWRQITELAAIDPTFAPYLDHRTAMTSQLEDLAISLRNYLQHIDGSPDRLQWVEERLASLDRLKRKFGPTLGDVLARAVELRRELGELESASDRTVTLEQTRGRLTALYETAAGQLSVERRERAAALALALEALLAELAMEETRFEVRFTGVLPRTAWSARGIDRAEFFVSPNPGEELRPLARIVSGGELSRIMLALKTITSEGRSDKTLVFDEVDAGIGGRVAEVVGHHLEHLGRAFQVLCITHLPQIAACGSAHFNVTKRLRRGRVMTAVERLDEDGRVAELARMLGGVSITDGIRATAREMLRRHRRQPAPKGGSVRAKGRNR